MAVSQTTIVAMSCIDVSYALNDLGVPPAPQSQSLSSSTFQRWNPKSAVCLPSTNRRSALYSRAAVNSSTD